MCFSEPIVYTIAARRRYVAEKDEKEQVLLAV